MGSARVDATTAVSFAGVVAVVADGEVDDELFELSSESEHDARASTATTRAPAVRMEDFIARG
jgi:hypothetical protein